MHWFERLSEMYSDRDIPLYHGEISTDICVHLSKSGDFLGAEMSALRIIAPVTEDSAVRTSGAAPHPLHDRLKYLAGEYREQYLELLGKWALSEDGTSELKEVYRYLFAGSLIDDLYRVGIEADMKQAVRFVVGGVSLWESARLKQAYISFCRRSGERSLCCVTGIDDIPARLHGKRIISRESSAKLISSGKEQPRKTCRGGYGEMKYTVGREVSFKAHTVLRRLIAESGYAVGNRVFLAFDTICGVSLPFSSGERMIPVGEVTVLGLCEATKGRLSVSFVRYLSAEEYHNACEEYLSDVGISPQRLVRLAFGHKSGGELVCSMGVEGLYCERILSCILDRRNVSQDVLYSLMLRAESDEDVVKVYSAVIAYNNKTRTEVQNV